MMFLNKCFMYSLSKIQTLFVVFIKRVEVFKEISLQCTAVDLKCGLQ